MTLDCLLDMRFPSRATALPLFALLLACACRNGDKATAPADAPSLARSAWQPARVAELYFTTEVLGHIEPCGCTTRPLGGLPRLAAVLERGHAARGIVDTGNLLFPAEGISEVTREQHLLKAKVLARAYRQMGALAINLAETDLYAGSEFLRDLQREGAVPFVSANVVLGDNGGPSVARSFLRTVGNIKVGITGAAMPEKVAEKQHGVTSIEYVPALAAEVKALRKRGAEIVVVLAHVGRQGARELVGLVSDVDVVLYGPGTGIEASPQAPERVGSAVIAEVGRQGQYVGRLSILVGSEPPQRPLVLDDGAQKEERRRALAKKKIRAFETEIATWRTDPKKAEAVKMKQAQIEALSASLSGAPAPAAKPDGPHIRIDQLPLEQEAPSNEAMAALLSAYYVELQRLNQDKGDVAKCATRDPSAPVFIGTEKCAECHEEAHAFWKSTSHAAAWDTLEKQRKHSDLTCIGCHTIGYAQPGGFCRLRDLRELKAVGCESCHGPGSLHARDQTTTTITRKTTEATCRSNCHVPEHSDGFRYDQYLEKIVGPGHGVKGS